MTSKSLEEKVHELYSLVEGLASKGVSEENPLVEIVEIKREPPKSNNYPGSRQKTNRTNEKHRIHVVLDENSKNRIQYLLSATEAANNSALIRQALKVYEAIILAELEGAEINFVHSNGSKSILKLL